MKQFTGTQLVILGLVGYLGYRLGRNLEKNKSKNAEVIDTSDEQNFISRMIDELKGKPNKTQKDRDNIDLLKIKLDQIINKK